MGRCRYLFVFHQVLFPGAPRPIREPTRHDENKRFYCPWDGSLRQSGCLTGSAAYSRSQSLFEQVDFRSSLEVADPLWPTLIRRRMEQHYSVQSKRARLKSLCRSWNLKRLDATFPTKSCDQDIRFSAVSYETQRPATSNSVPWNAQGRMKRSSPIETFLPHGLCLESRHELSRSAYRRIRQ